MRTTLFLVLGISLLALGFGLINMGARHSDFEQTGKVNRVVNHTIDPGIIVFGSSVSEVGIDPDILKSRTGLSAFNCSFNGTRFMQYSGLINEFNQYSRSNRYVILVETYFSFEKVDALSQVENFLPQINNKNVFKSLYAIQPDISWRSRYVPWYMFTVVTNRYYKNSYIGWRNILSRKNTGGDNGYYPVDRKWESDADEAIRITPPFSIQLDSEVIATYMKTIQSLTAAGRKVILVMTPMYTAMLRRITDISPLRNELEKIAAASGDSVRFLDFSRSAICDDRANFYNSNHLNLPGSKLFSTMLADSLAHIIGQNGSGKWQALNEPPAAAHSMEAAF